MPLSSNDKNFISSNLDTITSSFNNFKNIRPYMGVFKTEISKPYITFSTENTFGDNLFVGKKVCTYICTYISANDFNTQTSSFLA